MINRTIGQKIALDETNRAEAAHKPRLRAAHELLFNPYLSLLSFHGRVLEQALDDSLPLLERLKFLAILSSIIDEFFMIRIADLKERTDAKEADSIDGMPPLAQLHEIRHRVELMLAGQTRCLKDDILPRLKTHGISINCCAEISKAERAQLDRYFDETVLPILIPVKIDPAHPFPYIPSLSLNLGLMVPSSRDPNWPAHPWQFAYIKAPELLPRLLPVGDSSSRFVLIEDLIRLRAASFFDGAADAQAHLFRVTRDDDIEIRDESRGDLLSAIEERLPKRRFGDAVRLEVSSAMPSEMIDYLAGSIGLGPDDVYLVDGPMRPVDLMALYELNRPELKNPPVSVTIPPSLENRRTIFEAVAQQDMLLHHPYNSYSTVTDFIRTAAHDPDVLAIKICLYRTGHDSPIPKALIEASEKGKQVAVAIELKARFDEENNIQWAKRLEHAGVQVVYGLLGLKTHCKIALVIRREGKVLRRYVHIASGNYNPTTSTVYTDLGLLTVDDDIAADVTDLFNSITANSKPSDYHTLLVSPQNLRPRLIELIDREVENARSGRPARIVVKINRLTDIRVICALYSASQAGVPIDLIVRSACTLRPGVPGLSETITVRSIVGQFLEHSRIYFFADGGDEDLYIGSSDWMARNFDKRVEVVAPVNDPENRRYLIDIVLNRYLHDNVNAWRLLPNGDYERVRRAPGEPKIDSQTSFGESPWDWDRPLIGGC
jgi:polyphosphate kinase